MVCQDQQRTRVKVKRKVDSCSLGSVNLIDSFEKAKIAFDCISQFSALKTSPSAIDHDNNVLVPAGQVLMPISIKGCVDRLTRWTTIADSPEMLDDLFSPYAAGMEVRPIRRYISMCDKVGPEQTTA